MSTDVVLTTLRWFWEKALWPLGGLVVADLCLLQWPDTFGLALLVGNYRHFFGLFALAGISVLCAAGGKRIFDVIFTGIQQRRDRRNYIESLRVLSKSELRLLYEFLKRRSVTVDWPSLADEAYSLAEKQLLRIEAPIFGADQLSPCTIRNSLFLMLPKVFAEMEIPEQWKDLTAVQLSGRNFT